MYISSKYAKFSEFRPDLSPPYKENIFGIDSIVTCTDEHFKAPPTPLFYVNNSNSYSGLVYYATNQYKPLFCVKDL